MPPVVNIINSTCVTAHSLEISVLKHVHNPSSVSGWFVKAVEVIALNACSLTTGGRPVRLAWLWRPSRGLQTVQRPPPPVGEHGY